jgi:hypothetical protein
MRNSIQKGKVRYIVFKEGSTWYAAALEFNIVEEAETPQAALFYLLEAIRGYVKSAKKIKGRMHLALNQKPDAEYEKMWKAAEAQKRDHPIKSPYQIYAHGAQQLANV